MFQRVMDWMFIWHAHIISCALLVIAPIVQSLTNSFDTQIFDSKLKASMLKEHAWTNTNICETMNYSYKIHNHFKTKIMDHISSLAHVLKSFVLGPKGGDGILFD
jgi:hypothetical protein